MSKALRCNKCHGFFDPEEAEGKFLRIDSIVWHDKDSYKQWKYDNVVENWDLCPTCTKLFARFMDNELEYDDDLCMMKDGCNACEHWVRKEDGNGGFRWWCDKV